MPRVNINGADHLQGRVAYFTPAIDNDEAEDFHEADDFYYYYYASDSSDNDDDEDDNNSDAVSDDKGDDDN
ncbi:hypothetical protein HK405_005685, partial [Cladochytrium tenue]